MGIQDQLRFHHIKLSPHGRAVHEQSLGPSRHSRHYSRVARIRGHLTRYYKHHYGALQFFRMGQI